MAETYHRWRLPQLWEMVAADNAADAHLHLATLRRQQTALETQRDHLRSLRDHLAASWPPSKSEAATAFIQQLNDMIDAMTLTARGAGEVRAALTHVVAAIGETRAELEPLVARYAKASATADPRVRRHAQDVLDDQARRVLVEADSTVAAALEHLDVPLPAYARFSSDRQEEPTTVPPSTAQPAASWTTGSTTGGRLARTALPPPRFNPPAPDAFGLAGVRPADDLSHVAPETHAWGSAAGSAVAASTRGNVGGGLVLRGPTTGGAEPGAAGTVASSGAQVSGGAAAGRFAPATGPGVRPAAGSTPSVHHRREPREGQGETWSVREGVAPVIAAPASWSDDHDPGPGVLGIDR
ncbi:hypothetical protein [Dactylosporangium sp. NPDC006015]|uniref:hypothetical protein n=1 Tax=Dactylosporangium sp. NPDC006015 TaxID=3154576 RepID=UPI0033A64C57